MFAKIRSRLTYANVTATLALFVALGGAAYAVTLAPANSVNSAAIIDGQVKTADVAKNAVTGAQVKNGSLSGADVKGVTAKCPAGMTLIGAAHDLCIDSTDRSTITTWDFAQHNCRVAGFRLPTREEMVEAGDLLDNAGASSQYWTGELWTDQSDSGTASYVWIYSVGVPGDVSGPVDPGGTIASRCVATPSDA